MDEGHYEEAEGVADDDGDFGGDVAWGVGGAEGLWSWLGGKLGGRERRGEGRKRDGEEERERRRGRGGEG